MFELEELNIIRDAAVATSAYYKETGIDYLECAHADIASAARNADNTTEFTEFQLRRMLAGLSRQGSNPALSTKVNSFIRGE